MTWHSASIRAVLGRRRTAAGLRPSRPVRRARALARRAARAAAARGRCGGAPRARSWLDGRRTVAGRIASPTPSLVVVDDPSARHAARRVRSARARRAFPWRRFTTLAWRTSTPTCRSTAACGRPLAHRARDALGASTLRFSIRRSPSLRRERRRRRERHVLIALGGGAHVLSMGVRLATAISREVPGVTIDVATGFSSCQRWPVLPPGARWIHQPHGLGEALAMASVAVTAGGVTIYEACALGTPIVGFPVTIAQRQTTAAMAARGAAIDASAPTRARALRRAARAVAASVRVAGARAGAWNEGAGARRRARRRRASRSSCSGWLTSKPTEGVIVLPDRRAVVFDLDDTLYPYRRFVLSGFAAVAGYLARTHRFDRRRVLRLLARARHTATIAAANCRRVSSSSALRRDHAAAAPRRSSRSSADDGAAAAGRADARRASAPKAGAWAS